MPPIVTARMRPLPTGSVGWHVRRGVGTLLLGSALHVREAPVSLFKQTLAAPGCPFTTMGSFAPPHGAHPLGSLRLATSSLGFADFLWV